MDRILCYEDVLWRRMSPTAKDLLFDFESNLLNLHEDTFILDCAECSDESENIEKYLKLRGYNVYYSTHNSLVVNI